MLGFKIKQKNRLHVVHRVTNLMAINGCTSRLTNEIELQMRE